MKDFTKKTLTEGKKTHHLDMMEQNETQKSKDTF